MLLYVWARYFHLWLAQSVVSSNRIVPSEYKLIDSCTHLALSLRISYTYLRMYCIAQSFKASYVK